MDVRELVPATHPPMLTIPIAGDPLGEEAVDGIRALRDQHIPAAFPDPGVDVLVRGSTAHQPTGSPSR